MSKTAKYLTRTAWALSFAVVLPAIMAHHLLPSGPRPAASEFGLGPRTSAARLYTATLVTAQPLSTRGMQSIELALTDATGAAVDSATITVDGAMPEHGHGMPTQPRVTRALGDGRYQVEGVRFSMPGWWTLTFRVESPAGRDSVTFNLSL